MFGVKRTDKDFSRVPVDLTLEQTINAEAARKLTGVSHFTNSISARQRWAKSHGIRSAIISYIMDICGLKKAQDITAQLEKHQIKKDNLQLRTFIEVLRNNMNPFDNKKLNHDKLYNISTGRCASDSVANFLLKAEEIGELQRKEFITKCAKDINSFEESLKKNKILNFSSSHEKKKVYLVNKTQEVRMQRDLFGRMLGISIENNTDIEKVLSFPITPIPMSLCHTDGSIFKTDKSSLMKCLQVESTKPAHTDFVLIDGFFLLHCIKDVPRTFEGISKKILQILTNYNAPNIHLIFDRYHQPSIKDYERCMRGRQATDREYVISGPQQVRPPEFAKELRNDNFKTALVSFLIDHWESDSVAEFIGRKKILLNHIKCYSYEVDSNNKVIKSISNEFSCPWHEEADTKIVFHAMNINYAANITVRCSDTDILIILLGNMHHRKSQSNIWIDCGVSNKRRIIDVNKLSNFLGDDLCKALPGFHAFTGCDYNPAFFRKGKQRPFKIMSQSQKYMKAFSDLGDISCNVHEVFKILEVYTSHLYGITSKKQLQLVNSTRFEIFLRNYKITDVNEPFHKKTVKNFDASSLPPCQSELRQQFERARYISNVWSNAHLQVPTELEPTDCGWIQQGSTYEFKWFEGPQLPLTVNDVIRKDENEESGAEDDESEIEYASDEDEHEQSDCEC